MRIISSSTQHISHEPLDTMDQRYLKFSYAPIVSPLKKPLEIESYNDVHFPTNSKHLIKTPPGQVSCQLDENAFREHQVETDVTPSVELFQDSNTPRLPIETNTSIALDPITGDIDLSNQIFFIQYTPEGTLRRRWHLIQVDMESTLEVNPDFATNGLY